MVKSEAKRAKLRADLDNMIPATTPLRKAISKPITRGSSRKAQKNWKKGLHKIQSNRINGACYFRSMQKKDGANGPENVNLIGERHGMNRAPGGTDPVKFYEQMLNRIPKGQRVLLVVEDGRIEPQLNQANRTHLQVLREHCRGEYGILTNKLTIVPGEPWQPDEPWFGELYRFLDRDTWPDTKSMWWDCCPALLELIGAKEFHSYFAIIRHNPLIKEMLERTDHPAINIEFFFKHFVEMVSEIAKYDTWSKHPMLPNMVLFRTYRFAVDVYTLVCMFEKPYTTVIAHHGVAHSIRLHLMLMDLEYRTTYGRAQENKSCLNLEDFQPFGKHTDKSHESKPEMSKVGFIMKFIDANCEKLKGKLFGVELIAHVLKMRPTVSTDIRRSIVLSMEWLSQTQRERLLEAVMMLPTQQCLAFIKNVERISHALSPGTFNFGGVSKWVRTMIEGAPSQQWQQIFLNHPKEHVEIHFTGWKKLDSIQQQKCVEDIRQVVSDAIPDRNPNSRTVEVSSDVVDRTPFMSDIGEKNVSDRERPVLDSQQY